MTRLLTGIGRRAPARPRPRRPRRRRQPRPARRDHRRARRDHAHRRDAEGDRRRRTAPRRPTASSTARATRYGLTTAETDAASGTDPVSVSVPVTGLTSDTTYHVRVVATNAAGVTRSPIARSARSPPSAPPACRRARRRSGARGLRRCCAATLDPRGQKTTYRFEYGTTTKYGSVTPDVAAVVVGLEDGHRRRSAGLAPYTTYHYRLVATGPAGTTPRRATARFRTLRAPTGDHARRDAEPGGLGREGHDRRPGARHRRRRHQPVASSAATSRSPAASGSPGTSRPARTRASRRRSGRCGRPRACSSSRARRRSRAARSSTVGVRVRVGVRRQAAGRRAIVLSGVIRPAVPQGARVGAAPHARGGLGAGRADQRHARSPGTARATACGVAARAAHEPDARGRAVPNDGGAHEPGVSRPLAVRGR